MMTFQQEYIGFPTITRRVEQPLKKFVLDVAHGIRKNRTTTQKK